MKTTCFTLTRTVLVAGFALGAGSIASAQFNSPAYVQTAPAPAPVAVQVATPEMQSFALNFLAGKPLQSKTGQDVGTITDFLIDPQTGAVHFAVVPSGAGSGGETFRLVPIGALDITNTNAWRVKIGETQWGRVGTLVDQRLQGRIALNDELRERLGREFEMTGTPSDNVAEFVRASLLRGQPVRTASAQLGTVDDVLIDVRHKTAAVVLAPVAAPGVAAQKFLVPFDQLQLGTGPQAVIMTTLAPTVFQQVQAQPAPAYAPTGYTGYGNAPFTQAAAPASGQPVSAAASAVQQALARDQAAAGVQVVPESRLVLRGTVENQQKKLEIERAAIQAAPGMPIENQITVRNW